MSLKRKMHTGLEKTEYVKLLSLTDVFRSLVKHCSSGWVGNLFLQRAVFPPYLGIWRTVMGSLKLPLLHIKPFERLPLFPPRSYLFHDSIVYIPHKNAGICPCAKCWHPPIKENKTKQNWKGEELKVNMFTLLSSEHSR